jgi:hypothetical protein
MGVNNGGGGEQLFTHAWLSAYQYGIGSSGWRL